MLKMLKFLTIFPSLWILYYCSKPFVLFYFILNYFLAVLIYVKSTKCYFPLMKNISLNKEENTKKQYFHEDYPAFNRIELHNINLFSIYYGTINFFWFKAISSVLALALIYVTLR